MTVLTRDCLEDAVGHASSKLLDSLAHPLSHLWHHSLQYPIGKVIDKVAGGGTVKSFKQHSA